MKVYRNELSPEEYFTYSTEEKEKVKVMEYVEKYGSMELGITMLVSPHPLKGNQEYKLNHHE